MPAVLPSTTAEESQMYEELLSPLVLLPENLPSLVSGGPLSFNHWMISNTTSLPLNQKSL